MFPLILFLLFIIPNISYAACTVPEAGVAGQVKYISSDMMYCDGTNWITLTESNLGTSCTGEGGKISWLAPNLRFCNGTNWIKMNSATTAGGAGGAAAGTMKYDSATQKMRVSNGTDWYVMGSGLAPIITIDSLSPIEIQTDGSIHGTGISLTVTNTGTATSSVVSIGLSGPNAALFSISNDTCSTLVLAASDSCSFDLNLPYIVAAPPTNSISVDLTASAVSGGSSMIIVTATNSPPEM